MTNKTKRTRRPAHDEEILRGMARGPWALRWANEEEERGTRFAGGTDLYEAAPEAPRWVARWARGLADAIVSLNDASLEELYEAARADGFAKDRESFGYYLGMQAEGNGVRWDDDVSPNATVTIRVPSIELYEGASPDLRFISK